MRGGDGFGGGLILVLCKLCKFGVWSVVPVPVCC
jgi:hypothetical protein